MQTISVGIFLGVTLLFFVLAKAEARPGINAIALGILLALTPFISHCLPGHGDMRDAAAVLMLLVASSLGTALGGGLKPRFDEEHDHNHDHGAPISHDE